MLLCRLRASFLSNILAGKGINRAGEGAIAKNVRKETKSKKQEREIVRADYGKNKGQNATTITTIKTNQTKIKANF